ncbi:peroxisome biogenesis factor 10 [Leptidea sinapis]|uniref:peroxisome biogenesis factor 10 n=1 Tax=Leptidea sinapis TaxID=189913 RepID=UPI0021C3785B|nr:peroxisome biogenesis factor 10 [Leptidea sinapis]
MALPRAQPAEILRAWQKDDLYEQKLAGSLAKFVSPQYVSKTVPVSSLLYKSLTTLQDLQTLGEEYSGIVQVDDTFHRLPSFFSRLLSIILSTFGEDITKRLLKNAEDKVVRSATLKPEAQNFFLIMLKAMGNITSKITSIHRALSYISGGPIQIGKTLMGIDYVHVRPAVAYHAHLRLLGFVTLVHAFLSCGHSIYQAKKHFEQMSDFPNEVDSSKSCVACLEEIVNPCVLQCGHFFCMQCCYGPLEICALCRTPFTKNTVVPLMNFAPGVH